MQRCLGLIMAFVSASGSVAQTPKAEPATGELSGSLAPVDGTWPRPAVFVEAQDGKTSTPRVKWRGRRFRILGLDPGRYTIGFSLGSQGADLHRIRGVVVEAGAHSIPQLQDIETGQFCSRVEVRVFDDEGRPLDRATVTRHFETEEGLWDSVTRTVDKSGVARLFVARSGAHVTVERVGYRTVRIDSLTKNRVVILQPRPELRVGVRGMPEIPEYMRLRVLAMPPAPRPEWGDDEARPVRATIRVGKPGKMHVGGPGRYTLQLYAIVSPPNGANETKRIAQIPVEVRDETRPQEFEIVLDDAQRQLVDDLIETAKGN